MAQRVQAPDMKADQSPNYYNLGPFHRPVSTNNKDAQTWFDRGLIWSYAFNHEESAKCFEQALYYDENCTMAYWGLAYTIGPNYNKPWDVFDTEEFQTTLIRARHAVAQAKAKSGSATPVEQALITAIQFRYPEELDYNKAARASSNQAYAAAMESVYREFSQDLDVAALYVDALMNVSPWRLWDPYTGEPTVGSRAIEAQAVLSNAMTQPGAKNHQGLLHLFIHLVEMSPDPEAGIPAADALRGLSPDAGHLQHMPSHIDILCGDYRQAVACNRNAIRADQKFLARMGAAGSSLFYTLYRCHNLHFYAYAAMLSGQMGVALDGAERLEGVITEGDILKVKSPPMADWLECFMGIRVHVLVRFGLWHKILELELPNDVDLYCTTVAMIHYGKGIALSALGNIDLAEQERELFRMALRRVSPTRKLFNAKGIEILHVAEAMLDGELEYRRGNYAIAFEHLRQSVARYDKLPYDEPWSWMQPTRHAYAALLLEQGHVQEGAEVYKADLGLDNTIPRSLSHPSNVWALHGYYECLLKLKRKEEARILEPQLKMAMAVADIPIKASCFCRLNGADTVSNNIFIS